MPPHTFSNRPVANPLEGEEFATRRGQIVAPFFGEEALRIAWPSIVNSAWGLFDGGTAKVRPDQVGMPRQ